jgi:Putative polyhydroxyalkanoic acid system protein (PHA_gran_rgn)
VPDLDISVPHQLSQDEALSRLKSAIADAKAEHSSKIQELREEWNGYAGTLRVTAMGQSLEVVLTVNPSDIRVQSKLPFLASMFRGQIEEAIRQQGGKLLA